METMELYTISLRARFISPNSSKKMCVDFYSKIEGFHRAKCILKHDDYQLNSVSRILIEMIDGNKKESNKMDFSEWNSVPEKTSFHYTKNHEK